MEQSLGEFLRQWREARGLSQKDIGDRIGVDGQTISNLESGITKTMVLKNLRKLSEVVELPIDAVLRMSRVSRDRGPTADVTIPAELRAQVDERASALGVGTEEWVAAALAAMLKVKGWRPDRDAGGGRAAERGK